MKFCHLFSTRVLIFGLGILFLYSGPMTKLSFGQSNEFVEDASSESALPNYIDPTEIRRGVPMGGVPGKSRARLYYERIIQKIEPDLKGDPDRLPQYIEAFKSHFIIDERLFPFGVSAAMDRRGKVELTGYVGYEENRQALLQYMQFLGFEKIEDRIEVLPSRNVGKHPFAIVRLPFCISYDKPVSPREPMTQALMGDPIYLLKKAEDGYFLCQTAEGYVGYIHEDGFLRVSEEKFLRWQSDPRAVFQTDFQAEGFFIPAGARLKWEGQKGTDARVQLPGGDSITVPAASIEVQLNGVNPRVETAISIATRLLGTRYVWGGKSSQGVDCSGLVQSSFQAVGVNLPRDAYQQSYMGRLVATRWHREGLRRGDTLYFLGRSGKISHTAIYLGDGRYLEASGRDVHYTSFIPGDPDYEVGKDRSFCFAKRLFE
jgi:hypothetical protein